jgi:hypothetical protein
VEILGGVIPGEVIVGVEPGGRNPCNAEKRMENATQMKCAPQVSRGALLYNKAR